MRIRILFLIMIPEPLRFSILQRSSGGRKCARDLCNILGTFGCKFKSCLENCVWG
jgi:hypothetical protein